MVVHRAALRILQPPLYTIRLLLLRPAVGAGGGVREDGGGNMWKAWWWVRRGDRALANECIVGAVLRWRRTHHQRPRRVLHVCNNDAFHASYIRPATGCCCCAGGRRGHRMSVSQQWLWLQPPVHCIKWHALLTASTGRGRLRDRDLTGWQAGRRCPQRVPTCLASTCANAVMMRYFGATLALALRSDAVRLIRLNMRLGAARRHAVRAPLPPLPPTL